MPKGKKQFDVGKNLKYQSAYAGRRKREAEQAASKARSKEERAAAQKKAKTFGKVIERSAKHMPGKGKKSDDGGESPFRRAYNALAAYGRKVKGIGEAPGKLQDKMAPHAKKKKNGK